MATRIMVVDDELAIGKLLMYQLQGLGYEVNYVSDGMQALRQFALEPPDLVLLDVMMPHISGWEICRQIRACSSTPVIMLTAKGADCDVVTGLNAGADDYITKPFSLAQLQARIQTVMRRSSGMRPTFASVHTPFQRDMQMAALAVRNRAHYEHPVEQPKPAPIAEATKPATRLGPRLREARLSQKLSLHQVERACKIRWEFLQAIEQENFDYVPRSELRRVVRQYCEYLSLDIRDLTERSRSKSATVHAQVMPSLAFAMSLMMLLLAMLVYWYRM